MMNMAMLRTCARTMIIEKKTTFKTLYNNLVSHVIEKISKDVLFIISKYLKTNRNVVKASC